MEDAERRLSIMRKQEQQDRLLKEKMKKDGGQFMSRLIDSLEPSITDIELGSASSIKVLEDKINQRGVLITELEGNIKFVPKKIILRKSITWTPYYDTC
jgi:hypothetical protein